ncbi:protein BANP-like [Acropora muricata]|uniref:protein BANP-like n=1 Tax=Acropora muricata TaxID=159855 RepID=UPI0034E48409
MQRSQRKRCAPSWLKEKPYVKVRFTEDGVITKVTESWRIKLTQDSKELHGCLTKFTFLVGQIVWCYWKTANEKEKTYFEATITEVCGNSVAVTEMPSTDVDVRSSDEFAVNGNSEDFDMEASPRKKKRSAKDAKKSAKQREEKSTNSIDEEARAAKRLANKEKAEEEKARKEDNVQQSKELLRISDENMDMVFDFMQQIMSRLDSLEKKIDGNQQCFEKLSKKIEKRKKDHSLPVQVFVNKSGDAGTERSSSSYLSQTSFDSGNPPQLCSTPRAGLPARTSSSAGSPNIRESDDELDIPQESEPVSSRDAVGPSDNASVDSNESEPLCQADEMAIIGDPKFGVKTSKDCFDNIVNHSHSPSALALNLLDNLIPKEVQRISNIKGTNGKSPLNPMILAAIKGQLKRQFKWTEEEVIKNWGGKTGIQQKIADKCRNLNKCNNKSK